VRELPVLMTQASPGPFETWKPGIPDACLRGDIERTADLTIEEGSAKSPRLKMWELHLHPQNALSRASMSAASARAGVGL
jgi:hypothetical protein